MNKQNSQIDTSHLKGVFAKLRPEIRQAVAAKGYTEPSPIQEEAIPALLQGCDLLGSAQTGTGKTAAFSLPLLQKLSHENRRPHRGTPKALILAPTRELAAQIGDNIKSYSRFLRISHTVIFGGVNQNNQIRALNRGVDILIATPGRLLDLMNQGFINLAEIEVFILDEVDRMLDMGFIHDIRKVIAKIPDERQTLFFSATLPPKIMTLAESLVKNPVVIEIAPEQPAVERIDQRVLFVDSDKKDALLKTILDETELEKVIIFTQMKHVANRVVDRLSAAGIQSAAIHGNKSQSARVKALNGFKQGRLRVLVATDVAARGIDVDNVSHVINYDMPMEAETYVHRIGRTARAGADGTSISFCTAEDRAYLKAVDKLLDTPVPVDINHAFHSDRAQNSNMPAPRNFGRGQSRGGRGGGRPQSRGRQGGRPGSNRPGGNRSGGNHNSGNRHNSSRQGSGNSYHRRPD
ncbi:MAG: DEAD/DEAH box helicase [Spirochaetales bacterium]|uniref:DEAD-box ATP-dependent RNA helicase RhpA n=1 Tax=Candidatus Thalassospirochaeta sargassi TaxID=3119039 RepID=A0AAJ1III7_9SPIO|nr:DEAD/DEAH box helicase [Spirochaetales bacterium]